MFLKFFSYLAVYIIWGTTYFFMKVAVGTLDPFYVVTLRNFLGSMVLLEVTLVLLKGRLVVSRRQWGYSILVGSLLLIGGSGLVTVALQRVDSYFASLVIACTPLMVGFTDRLILGNKLNLFGFIGAVLGVFGVGFLLNNGNSLWFSLSPHVLLLFFAVLLWSTGTSLGKRLDLPENGFVRTGLQMFSVGCLLFMLLQVINPVTMVNWSSVSLVSWFGVGYLSLFGTLAFAAYTHLVRVEPNYRVVSYAFVNPLIAVFLGLWLGGEVAVQGLVPGAILIFSGLAVMFYGPRLPRIF